MAKVTINVEGNTADWLISTSRKAKWTASELAATILDVGRQMDERLLLVEPQLAGPTIDDNVSATVSVDLEVTQRVFDPEGDPGLVLKLFNIGVDGEAVALVLKLDDIAAQPDLSQVDPEDTFVWLQADLTPNV